MFTVDPAVVTSILAFGGVGVVGLTEMVKRLLRAEGFVAYLLSFVISALATAFILAVSGGFNLGALAVYTVLVFLEANGIYKVVRKNGTE